MLGLVRDLNPGPLAPKARIIPLDQRAKMIGYPLKGNAVNQERKFEIYSRKHKIMISGHFCNKRLIINCGYIVVKTAGYSMARWSRGMILA